MKMNPKQIKYRKMKPWKKINHTKIKDELE
jgi:hypothetical protein